MHGGLSPELDNFEQIKKIERPTDVPDAGIVFIIEVCCVIFCGLTQTRMFSCGGRTREESPILSVLN